MVSVNKQNHQSKKEKNPNQPSTSSDTEDRNPNPDPDSNQMDSSSSLLGPLVIEGSEEDTILEKSEYLTREEVIRRRLRRVKQMERFYKDHYWSLMEELRVKHREYYWEFGKSPFKEGEIKERGENHSNNNLSNGGGGAGGLANGGGVVEGSGNNHNNGNGGGGCKLGVVNGGEDKDVKYRMCDFNGCKSKVMPLANYCHQHITLDTRQTLYKSCSYVTKSGGSAGPIRCGKTILSSNLPLLCSPHFQKAEKHVTRALRLAGLNNITSSSKLAPPKLHIIVAESVRQINAKRREKRAAMNNGAIEE